MKLPRVLGCWGLLLAILAGSVAQAAEKKAKAKAAPEPAYAEVKDDPALPRVLLIGDSISIGYTLPVREALAGKANVHRPATNCGPTINGIKGIDAWLGKGKWDVIHFNFGLHDLKRMEDGNQQVPLEQYEENLRKLVARLQKTGAVLIWCSTTPVPETSKPPRSNKDVVAYNAAAKKIMEENHIAIDDLYGFALPKLQEIQLPKNVHYTREGSKVLAGQVARTIEETLASRKAAEK